MGRNAAENCAEYLGNTPERHYHAAIWGSCASVSMWMFALVAFLRNDIQLNQFTGISISVVYLVLISLPAFPFRTPHKHPVLIRTYERLALPVNLLTVFGYTAILYFLGGIEAAYLTPIYAAHIMYVGIVWSRRLPIFISLVCSASLAFITVGEHLGFLPNQDPVHFHHPWPDQLMILAAVAGLLFVIAVISLNTADLLAKIRRRVAEQNTLISRKAELLEQSQRELKLAHLNLERKIEGRTSELKAANERLQSEIQRRQKAEEELRESERRYRSIFENSLDGIFLTDLEGRILAANPEACRMHGYPEDEIRRVGRNGVTDASDPRVMENIAQRAQTGYFRAEHNHIRKDGSKFPCEVTSGIFRDLQGRKSSVVIFRDITERKRAEEMLRKANEELEERVQSRTAELELKNQELQQFAFTASHDLNEPLRKIQMFGDLVMQKCRGSLDDHSLDYLCRMQKASKRMQTLLTALLDYSRVSTRSGTLEPVDLGEVAAEALSNVEYWVTKENGRVQIDELPVVESVRPQMILVFQNLLSNALKYHEPGVTPVVRVCSRHSEDGKSAKGLQIFFEDNGIGFDEKYLDKIFKPFERLHGKGSAYSGVGMGLSICKKIVERHGGSITATSAPGKGSTFIVSLPADRMTEPMPSKVIKGRFEKAASGEPEGDERSARRRASSEC